MSACVTRLHSPRARSRPHPRAPPRGWTQAHLRGNQRGGVVTAAEGKALHTAQQGRRPSSHPNRWRQSPGRAPSAFPRFLSSFLLAPGPPTVPLAATAHTLLNTRLCREQDTEPGHTEALQSSRPNEWSLSPTLASCLCPCAPPVSLHDGGQRQPPLHSGPAPSRVLLSEAVDQMPSACQTQHPSFCFVFGILPRIYVLRTKGF